MRIALLTAAGCIAFGIQPANAQAPSLMPQYTTNPAELPKVFAIAIRAVDPARSIRFYREAMGATKVITLTPKETVVAFPSGIGLNIVPRAEGAAGGDGPVGFVFQTADIDGLAARVVTAGGTLARPPSDGKATGGVRVAFVLDPDGSRIEVIQFPKG
jgi:predicted enzyme related to lactoylglutathione lyase